MLRLTLLTNPDICNLRCPLCFLQQRGRKFGMGEMPFEIALRSLENALRQGLREVIPSTMGEPLLYASFGKLLEWCCLHNVPINLTTNGSFPGAWNTDEGMHRLIESCSDIKVSCMGWGESFSEMMPGLSFGEWKKNVEHLVTVSACVKRCICQSKKNTRVSSVSLQVTLHKKNFEVAIEILHWAESIGINRIKWNLPVLLSCSSGALRKRYCLLESDLKWLRNKLVSDKVLCEGSLFFKGEKGEKNTIECPFVDDLWVLPDGSEQHCPNPERRFGNKESQMAQCENCPMK